MTRTPLASLRLRLPHLALPLLVVPLALAACTTVPGTERKQVMMVPLSMEMSLGGDGYQQSLAESKVVTSGPDYEQVQRVGQRIAASAKHLYPEPAAQFKWEIVLIDEPETANAWCMPGGKMAVYTGLLPITQDENSLAIVVGHEVAHAVARHGGERMSQGILFDVAMQAASASMSNMDPGERDMLMQAMVGGGTLGVILPFSRKHESEADELGLYIAADAGYDPQASIGLWERMGAKSQGQAPPEFLSTHPSSASRIEHLKEVMPQALAYYEASQKQTASPFGID
jgi:predicted Zn-dependent protease